MKKILKLFKSIFFFPVYVYKSYNMLLDMHNPISKEDLFSYTMKDLNVLHRHYLKRQGIFYVPMHDDMGMVQNNHPEELFITRTLTKLLTGDIPIFLM